MQDANLLYLKKRYIKWFLDSFLLKEPETIKVLSFIYSNDELLEKVHFVSDIRKLPNAMLLSAAGTHTVSFLFRLNGDYYEDINQIVSTLSNTPPKELFVRLAFNQDNMCSYSQDVLEPVPEVRNKVFYQQVVKDLEEELNKTAKLRMEGKEYLLKKIDKALKQGNRDLFYKYSYIYRQIS